MKYNEWIMAYTLIQNKLHKKSPLSAAEIDEILELIEKIYQFINNVEYEVMKRQ